MNKRTVKKLAVGIVMAVIFLFPTWALLAQEASSGTYNFQEQSGLNITARKAGYDSANPTSIETIVSTIIYTALSLVGIVFLAMAMFGGFTWMTAMGNSEQVTKANKMIMSSLFGLMITLSAYVISYFLINYFWK